MNDVKYCEYLTGLPPRFYDFLASFETNGGSVEFYSSAPVEVNWGHNKWIKYEAGVVHGFQNPDSVFKNSPVQIRSEEKVLKFRFGSGVDYDRSYLKVDIHKAFGLEDAEKLCYRLEEMREFSFFGTNQVTTFKSAWEDCTELLVFEGMDTTRAVTFQNAWKNCNKLKKFPSIYSRECTTVESGWLGCTSMEEFPIIGVENCLNFRNAWRGNVNLTIFPFIDTGMGQDFDHAWAYCPRLGDFPTLDFKNATNMNNAVAYNYRIKALPFFNTAKSKTFKNMFRKCLSLECISGIDTISTSSRLDTENMFMLTDKLQRPDMTEQYYIQNGTVNGPWRNDEPCYFDAGRSTFFVRTATSGELCQIEVTGGDIEIDWGDGLWLHYNEGYVEGMPITTNGVNIRSEENVTRIKFISDTWMSIQIKRGKTLETFEEMCMGLHLLDEFEIIGHLKATNYDRMLKDCINLTMVEYVDLSHAETMVETFMNCNSLLGFEIEEGTNIIDMARCKDFTRTFYSCFSLDHLPVLVTTMGEKFDEMFHECLRIKCIYGIDTRNQLSTANMFHNNVALVRPNKNEIPKILNGSWYRNNGNCSTLFNIRFQDNGAPTDFTVDEPVEVDWGDGVFHKYAAGTISGQSVHAGADVYVSGKVTAVSFDTDTFTEVEFMNADGIADFDSMFENKQELKVFRFSCVPQSSSLNSMFKDSGIEHFYSHGLGTVEDFQSMFEGCSALVNSEKLLTENGKFFENMFKGCINFTCLGGIDTRNGEFPPNYIICDHSIFNCTENLNCTPGQDLHECGGVKISCTPGQDLFDCYAPSSMFEGCAALMSPDALEQKEITSRELFLSPVC